MPEIQKALNYYKTMLTARLLDQIELAAVGRGEAWFHTSGAGHEGGVVLNTYLQDQDWLHCHYRDRALMLARGVSSQEFFNSLFCNAESSSYGRQMNPLTSCKAKNIMSMVIPVGNGALQSVGVATALKNNSDKPIVVCSIGDGGSQQGEFLEAVAEAVRSELPVLFFVQDNSLAISTRTQGQTFFSFPESEPEEFYGIPINRIDGRDVMEADKKIAPIIRDMRSSRKPAIILFKVERLDSHSNADDQASYRSAAELQRCITTGDPLSRLQDYLLDNGVGDEQLLKLKCDIHSRLSSEEEAAKQCAQPLSTTTALQPLPAQLTERSRKKSAEPLVAMTMREAINKVLRHHLQNNELVTLYGEDIEDPKGDVFGVTKGLSTSFKTQVRNSPLSESTIIGVSIGRALAGEKPVCFIQFADFLPHALNQIMSELATLYWRSNGEWNAPLLVIVACGAYKPGMGPFHAQSMEAILTHTPGLDVLLPSNASDAAGLLNSAFLSDRPSIFFYPKSCLNLSGQLAPKHIHQHFVPLGSVNFLCRGTDLTLVAWGNTVSVCEQVAKQLQAADISVDLIDVRSLSPWDQSSILASAQKTGSMIVVHEDNHTCGFGAEIVATIAEKANRPVTVRRMARPDTYLPFNFVNQMALLPTFESVLECAAELLELSLSWEAPDQVAKNCAVVTAIGSGPSDETVEILEILVKIDDDIVRGDLLLVMEASKSIVDMTSSWSGRVTEILVSERDVVKVGAPVITLITNGAYNTPPALAPLTPRKAILRKLAITQQTSRHPSNSHTEEIGIYQIATVTGSHKICNDRILAQLCDDKKHSGDEIEKLTGIVNRNWIGAEESVLSLATAATKQLVQQANINLDDIDLILCSTTTPNKVSPSLACQVLGELTNGKERSIQAYDIFAACSGYLYALQSAYDYICNKPEANVLIITAETLSPLLNPADFDTYILFGDAATATLVCGNKLFAKAKCKLHRPVLSAKKDKNGSLLVPIKGQGYIEMEGRVVFTEAVRSMNSSLLAACEQEGIALEDLQLVVPHQASQRIIKAVQDRIKLDVYSNVKEFGNTSSSSIPLGLNDALSRCDRGSKIGLCAFGAGFTFGAGILKVL